MQPRVCVACGYDRSDQVCARCRTDSSSALWTRASPPSKPSRSRALGSLVRWITPAGARHFDFDDRALDAHGRVTIVGAKIVEASGQRRFLHAVRGPELPDVARTLSSVRMVPYPLDLETPPSTPEIVRGAFVCALLGMAARGLLDLAFDAWVRWERRGPFVLSAELEAAPSLWLRRAPAAPSLELPALERALLDGLDDSSMGGGYRSHATGWTALASVLAAARSGVPSIHAIESAARILPYEDELVLEQLRHESSRLIHALAGSADLLHP